MNKNKILIGTLAVIGLTGLAGVYTVQKTFAETQTRQTLMQRIVEKFNLNQNEVDNVVNQYRGERQAERLTEVTSRLNQAVSDGKITEDQKNKILAKIQEWQNRKDEWQNLTREERRTKMDEHRDEMEKWAEENGIDMHEIMSYGGGMMFGGNGMESGKGRGRGMGPGFAELE